MHTRQLLAQIQPLGIRHRPALQHHQVLHGLGLDLPRLCLAILRQHNLHAQRVGVEGNVDQGAANATGHRTGAVELPGIRAKIRTNIVTLLGRNARGIHCQLRIGRSCITTATFAGTTASAKTSQLNPASTGELRICDHFGILAHLLPLLLQLLQLLVDLL